MDLKNERFDLAIRIADLKSADLIAAKLARNHRVVCGSPAYFKRAGKPRTLADLAKHNCLVTSTEDGVADSWNFQDKGKPDVREGGGQPAVQRRRGAHALGASPARASPGAAPGR